MFLGWLVEKRLNMVCGIRTMKMDFELNLVDCIV
jgi:hypothetical protein